MSRHLLKLYPEAWRRRYEREMAALLEEAPPGLRAQLDLLRGALLAHLHPIAGLEPLERARASVTGVLGAFICFCFAGAAFAKTTEATQFDWAGRHHDVLGGAHHAVVITAVIAAAFLACAAAPLAWTAVAQARRTRERGLIALICVPPVAIACWVGSLGLLALWVDQHNHKADAVAWLLLALCGVVTVLAAGACWWAPRRILRRLAPSRASLALSVRSLAAVAVCMAAVAIATAVYLAAILADAPSLAASGDGPGAVQHTAVDISVQLAAMLALASLGALSALRGSEWPRLSARSAGVAG